MKSFANLLVLLDGFILNLVNPCGGVIPLNLFNSDEIIPPGTRHNSHSPEEHQHHPLQPPHFGKVTSPGQWLLYIGGEAVLLANGWGEVGGGGLQTLRPEFLPKSNP